MRLRCPEGDAPSFSRSGSFGTGPYGTVIDAYRVVCSSGRQSDIFMDMYHQHKEMGDVPGFKTLPELPARIAKGCPPEVPGAAPGTYIFQALELERPSGIDLRKAELSHPDVDGWVYARLTISADGRVDPSSMDFPLPSLDPRLKELVSKYLGSLQLDPPLHKPGCPVPQRFEGGIEVRKSS